MPPLISIPAPASFQGIPAINPNNPVHPAIAARDPLVPKVHAALRLAAPAGSRVLAAISGGPDSVALAHIVKGLPYRLYLGHIDHRLRPGSAADARFVRSLARDWELPCAVQKVSVRLHARR